MKAVFIGSPNSNYQKYFQECKSFAEKSENIHLLSNIQHDDPLLASAYAAAAVFVLPSDFETFGIAALEAAIAGAPLVLTNNIRSRDLFESFSHFADPNNEEDIAKAIKKAIQEKRESRRNLLDEYSWNSLAKKLESYYIDSINKK